MISQISNALSKGFTSKQIIDFLIKKFPEHSDKIKTALASGYTVDKILKYLGGGRKSINRDLQPQTEYEKTLGTDIQRKENVNKGALTGAALAATSLAAPMAAQALQRAIPSNLTSIIPQLAQSIQPQAPLSNTINLSSQGPQQPPIVNQTPSNIAQPQQVMQPEININPKEYLEKLGIKDKVDDLLKRGNSPEQAAAALGMKDGTGRLKSEINPELLANIDAYSKEPKQETAIETPKEIKPIAKNETVVSPHGVGEIITSRNGKSIIEVDGKKHQVDDKSLLKPPKEAAVEALELIKGFTPEEMRSTHHMLNAYDEGEKKAFFVFHNGSAYVVDDISPEEYKELSEEIEAAKTTGETIIGEWASGEGSRGAGYNKVVKGVRNKKVVPELKKKYRKLKVGYNLLAEWQRLLNEK